MVTLGLVVALEVAIGRETESTPVRVGIRVIGATVIVIGMAAATSAVARNAPGTVVGLGPLAAETEAGAAIRREAPTVVMGIAVAPRAEMVSRAATTETAGTGLVRVDTALLAETGSVPVPRAMIVEASAAIPGIEQAPATTGRATTRATEDASPIGVTTAGIPRPGAPQSVGVPVTTVPVVGPVAPTVRTPPAAANAGSTAMAAGRAVMSALVGSIAPSVGTTRPRVVTDPIEVAVAVLAGTMTEARDVMTGRGDPISPRDVVPRTVRTDPQARAIHDRAARRRVVTSVATGIRAAATSIVVTPLGDPMIGAPAAARTGLVPSIVVPPADRMAIVATTTVPASTTVGPVVTATDAIPVPTGRSVPTISDRPMVIDGAAHRTHARIGQSAPTTAGRPVTTTAEARIARSARMTAGRRAMAIGGVAPRQGVPTVPTVTETAVRVGRVAIDSRRAVTTVGLRTVVGTTGPRRYRSRNCPRTSS